MTKCLKARQKYKKKVILRARIHLIIVNLHDKEEKAYRNSPILNP